MLLLRQKEYSRYCITYHHNSYLLKPLFQYPKSVGGDRFAITAVRDLTTGHDSSQPDQRAILPVSSSSQMITFTFGNGCVLTLRTSGTEPKIKYYSEMCATPEQGWVWVEGLKQSDRTGKMASCFRLLDRAPEGMFVNPFLPRRPPVVTHLSHPSTPQDLHSPKYIYKICM